MKRPSDGSESILDCDREFLRRIAMDDAKRFEVRQVVAAPIEQVFAVVADPRKHVGIDGSGMLQRTDSGQRWPRLVKCSSWMCIAILSATTEQ
jgi:hypothetical protein